MLPLYSDGLVKLIVDVFGINSYNKTELKSENYLTTKVTCRRFPEQWLSEVKNRPA